MVYIKNIWATGDSITPEKLNNIETGIENLNLGEMLDSVAEIYKPNNNYLKGQYVIYNNKLYCINSNNTSGEWQDNYGTQTRVDELIADLQATILQEQSDREANIKYIEDLIAWPYYERDYSTGEYALYGNQLFRFYDNYIYNEDSSIWDAAESVQITDELKRITNMIYGEENERKYSSSTQYQIGDYIINNDGVYRCIQSTNGNESWSEISSSHFEKVNNIYDELSSIIDKIKDLDAETINQYALDSQTYAEQAQAYAQQIQSSDIIAYITGQRNGSDVTSSGDPVFHNNARYYCQQASQAVSQISNYTTTGYENLINSIASSYETPNTYPINSYCLSNGKLYKATDTIEVNGQISSYEQNGCFEQTSIGQELKQIKQDIDTLTATAGSPVKVPASTIMNFNSTVGTIKMFDSTTSKIGKYFPRGTIGQLYEKTPYQEYWDPENMPRNNNSYYTSWYTPCLKGQIAHIWTSSGISARSYLIVSNEGILLQEGPGYISGPTNGHVSVIIPEDGYLCINVRTTVTPNLTEYKEMAAGESYVIFEKPFSTQAQKQYQIVEKYNPNTIYKENDYIYNGEIYKNILSTGSPESFDEDHWIKTTIGKELTQLNNSFFKTLRTDNLNTLSLTVTNGQYINKNSGVSTAGSSYARTGLILTTDIIAIKFELNDTYNYYLSFYDGNGNLSNGTGYMFSTETSPGNIYYIPKDAIYVCINYKLNSGTITNNDHTFLNLYTFIYSKNNSSIVDTSLRRAGVAADSATVGAQFDSVTNTNGVIFGSLEKLQNGIIGQYQLRFNSDGTVTWSPAVQQ